MSYIRYEKFKDRTTFRIQKDRQKHSFTIYLETLGDDPRVIWVNKGFYYPVGTQSLRRTLQDITTHFGEELYRQAFDSFNKEMDEIIPYTEIDGYLIVKQGERGSEQIMVCGFDDFGIVDERGRVHIPRDILAL
tara:strand:- start:52 stop:453 length:402 start_codon:yes stop_codon:yes gene_type:complete